MGRVEGCQGEEGAVSAANRGSGERSARLVDG
jgi:hypothetical protein